VHASATLLADTLHVLLQIRRSERKGTAMPISINEMVTNLTVASAKLNGLTLSGKIAELKRSRSSDPVQQLQTEAIVELYDAVKQIQEAIWPMLAIIPDVSGVRDAASSTMMSPMAKLRTPPRFTR
jgi:predicted metal-dependent peptidase